MQMSGSSKVEMSAFPASAGVHGPLTLSMKGLDRLDVMTRIAERCLTRRRAAGLLQIGERQVRRLYRAFVHG